MPTTANRRLFLKQLLALSVTGIGASACQGRAETAPPPTARAAGPATVAPALGGTTSTPTPGTAATAAAGPAPTRTPSAVATERPPTTAGAAPEPAAAAVSGRTRVAIARRADADPAELTRLAVAALGGIERFVKPGANVVVKPNICTAYHGPEYASTTNPQVVAAVVALCLGAGAKSVRVMDAPFGGTAQAAYAKSGIAEAVQSAGGEMAVMSRMRYRELAIPDGRTIRQWQVYGDALDADVLINLPIAKNHGSTRLTLGMKNLMGLIQDRGSFHSKGLDQCIADLNSALRPQLTIVDAVRILVENGPTGGNLDDVKRTDAVIASADTVAADALAATLFGMTGKDIGYIRLGAEMQLGQGDLGAVDLIEAAG